VKCGDLGCARTTPNALNACSTYVGQAQCAYRATVVDVQAALSKLEWLWDEVMDGVGFWLTKWAGAIGMDILKEIRGKKSTIITAIKIAVGTTKTMSPNSFKTIVINSIKAAVPAAGSLFLRIGKGISFPFLVWDIMNWDCFVVKAS
jgi:hypothetical protein